MRHFLSSTLSDVKRTLIKLGTEQWHWSWNYKEGMLWRTQILVNMIENPRKKCPPLRSSHHSLHLLSSHYHQTGFQMSLSVISTTSRRHHPILRPLSRVRACNVHKVICRGTYHTIHVALCIVVLLRTYTFASRALIRSIFKLLSPNK